MSAHAGMSSSLRSARANRRQIEQLSCLGVFVQGLVPTATLVRKLDRLRPTL